MTEWNKKVYAGKKVANNSMDVYATGKRVGVAATIIYYSLTTRILRMALRLCITLITIIGYIRMR